MLNVFRDLRAVNGHTQVAVYFLVADGGMMLGYAWLGGTWAASGCVWAAVCLWLVAGWLASVSVGRFRLSRDLREIIEQEMAGGSQVFISESPPQPPVSPEYVAYWRGRKFGDGESEGVEITADIQPGETADDALERAKSWVNDKLNERQEAADLLAAERQEVVDLRAEKRRLVDDISQLDDDRKTHLELIRKARAWCDKYGVSVEDFTLQEK